MAGSSSVVHLHGCVNSIRCEECSVRVRKGLQYDLFGDEMCPVGCRVGSMMRNDIVLFDEDTVKPYKQILRDLQDATENCAFVIIGCSLTIFDWARISTRARKILVNTDENLCYDYVHIVDDVIHGDISQKTTLDLLSSTLGSFI